MTTKLQRRIIAQVKHNTSRAIEYGLTEHFTLEQWQSLLTESQGRCYYCKTEKGIGGLVAEHRLDMSLGGSNTIENIVPACPRCNHRKKGRSPDDPFPVSVEPCGDDEVVIVSGRARARVFRSQLPDLIAKLAEYTY